MKPLSVSTLIASAFLLAMSLPASAAAGGPVPAAPGQNKLQCFDGITDTANADPAGSYGPYGGTCTLAGKGAKGPATLDNTVLVGSVDYAGVYVFNRTSQGSSKSYPPTGEFVLHMIAPDSYRHAHAGGRILIPVWISANLVRDEAAAALRRLPEHIQIY